MRGGKLKLHIPVHYPMKIADPKVGTGRPTSVNEAAGEKKHQSTKHYVRTKQTTACNKRDQTKQLAVLEERACGWHHVTTGSFDSPSSLSSPTGAVILLCFSLPAQSPFAQPTR